MKRSAFTVEAAVGLFLLLGLCALLALAFASTNGRIGLAGDTYEVSARFSNVGELRPRAPVKIGGVTIGSIARVELDPERFDAIAVLTIDRRFDQIPADSSAAVYTSGLLGERYISITPGGDVEVLGPGDEIFMTQSAVVLEQLIGKYIFGGADESNGDSK
ncbi:MAG TPA: outer membrane lipid asymmetry maintenance protein MlaD [Xanthomonadales bacterium]|nr:outer membrane lipid asymmetry maintenance protein MlaD [Xanthomonadales bacterium]